MKKRFTMMIIDDEENVRSLIKKCIDWDKLGINIAYESGTAENAFEILKKNPSPSIICVDICMPVVNGIEFISEIKKQNVISEVVVISGYGDFKYAQQCIRLGVSDYILKPINDETLFNSMKKICERLDSKKLDMSDEIENKVIVTPAFHNKSIEEIKEYTQKNFSDNNISLQLLADKFYLNSAYICRAFKKETGENWNDFLNKLRMEKAIELLKTTNMLSYEISNQVGFTDAKYFSLCFKQYTGKKFTKYRQEIGFTK